jgi:hypothetical protein
VRHALLRPTTPRHPPPTSSRLRLSLVFALCLLSLQHTLICIRHASTSRQAHRRGRTPNRGPSSQSVLREHTRHERRQCNVRRVCLYPIQLSKCFCGAGRVRTADHPRARRALSQLSYDPTGEQRELEAARSGRKAGATRIRANCSGAPRGERVHGAASLFHLQSTRG